MTPHRALNIPEVLHEVFKYLATHPWLTSPGAERDPSSNDDSEASVRAKRRTLAYAARTCKAFAEPASQVLWEVQDGFEPIVSVLKNTQVSGASTSTMLLLTTRSRFQTTGITPLIGCVSNTSPCASERSILRVTAA